MHLGGDQAPGCALPKLHYVLKPIQTPTAPLELLIPADYSAVTVITSQITFNSCVRECVRARLCAFALNQNTITTTTGTTTEIFQRY